MRIQNSKSWVEPSFGRSALNASVILLAAFVIRLLLHPYIDFYAPFHFFIVACVFIAYYYGYRLALMGILISSFVGSYFFVKPYNDMDSIGVTDVIQFINFSLVSVIAVLMIERLQRSVYKSGMLLKVLESRHKISMLRENDRMYFSKKNNESWSILEEILTDFDGILFLKYGAAHVKLYPLFLELSKSPKHMLAPDEWESLIHPEDLPTLLKHLHHAQAGQSQQEPFTLRFANDPGGMPHSVSLEEFNFMDKPLRILRLAAQ